MPSPLTLTDETDMTITVTQEGDLWIIRSAYEDREIVKAAGARWNPTRKTWWTDKPEVAEKLAQGDVAAVAAINAERAAKHARDQAAIEASRAVDADIDLPIAKGCAYLPYQKAGVAFASARRDTLIGDQMGLGKTLQAIGVINSDPSITSVLVIAPASLKINWLRECKRFLARQLTIGLANGAFPESNIVITNYEMVGKQRVAIDARQWDLLVCDESHYLKNDKAQRTANVLGRSHQEPAKRIAPIAARRRLALTGTPILNRPKELWTICKAFDPHGLGANWRGFHTRYCAGYRDEYGWQIDGASHLDELNSKLRSTFMVRRLKEDVLKELPPKRRQIIALEPQTRALRELLAKEKALLGDDYEAAAAKLVDNGGVDFTELSEVRHQIALAKVPQCVEHIRETLESIQKVVVFCHHRDVANALFLAFADVGAVKATGDLNVTDRQASVDRFQAREDCRVFVGSIKAAGVGITLTAASTVIFCEPDWTPGWVQQAEDRCHRIGQRDNVLVQHIVLDGSLDAWMVQMLVDKQAIADAALDEAGAPLIAPAPIALTASLPVAQRPVQAFPSNSMDELTTEQREAVHEALKRLAGVCDGAFQLDGQGFNRLDASFGHDLAARSSLTQRQAAAGRKLAIKYQRQIGPELISIIRGER